MSDRKPWTWDDLEYLIPQLEETLAETEERQRDHQLAGQDEVKPLPPMSSKECLNFLCRLIDAAGKRPLTARECFIHGQLLCQFKQAAIAEALGKKGRFYLIDEHDVVQMISND